MRRHNKKAALELSINAIVVLILAITILGLGLGFIKKQFSGLGEQFESVSAEMKGEIIEKIRSSGELLVFNMVEIDAQIGKPTVLYVGIKNTGAETTCFKTYIECMSALKGDCSVANPGQKMSVGGASLAGEVPTAGDNWFEMFEEVDIEGNDVGVYPITLQIPGKVRPDTYLLKFEVFKAESGECGGSPLWPNDVETPYQSKQFYVNVR